MPAPAEKKEVQSAAEVAGGDLLQQAALHFWTRTSSNLRCHDSRAATGGSSRSPLGWLHVKGGTWRRGPLGCPLHPQTMGGFGQVLQSSIANLQQVGPRGAVFPPASANASIARDLGRGRRRRRASAASMARRSASSTASARVRRSAARGIAHRLDVDVAGADLRPAESAAACSITFSSSRTLPGQSCAMRRASASGVSAFARRSGRALEEVGGEERDVLAALAERRDADADHVEPVVEVLAEAPLRDRAAEVLVRRGDDADVHLDGRRSRRRAGSRPPGARAAASPGSRARSRRSRRGRACRRSPPRRGRGAPDRAGERALRVAEQLGLSRSVSVIAAQFTRTNGRSPRRLATWIARATSSLPVPDSPVTSTVASVGAIRITRSSTSRIAVERPTMCSRP